MSVPRPLHLPATFRYVAFGVATVASAMACSGGSGSSAHSSDAGITDGSKLADGANDSPCPTEGYCGNVMNVADASCPDANVCSMADCPAPCTFI